MQASICYFLYFPPRKFEIRTHTPPPPPWAPGEGARLQIKVKLTCFYLVFPQGRGTPPPRAPGSATVSSCFYALSTSQTNDHLGALTLLTSIPEHRVQTMSRLRSFKLYLSRHPLQYECTHATGLFSSQSWHTISGPSAIGKPFRGLVRKTVLLHSKKIRDRMRCARRPEKVSVLIISVRTSKWRCNLVGVSQLSQRWQLSADKCRWNAHHLSHTGSLVFAGIRNNQCTSQTFFCLQICCVSKRLFSKIKFDVIEVESLTELFYWNRYEGEKYKQFNWKRQIAAIW